MVLSTIKGLVADRCLNGVIVKLGWVEGWGGRPCTKHWRQADYIDLGCTDEPDGRALQSAVLLAIHPARAGAVDLRPWLGWAVEDITIIAGACCMV